MEETYESLHEYKVMQDKLIAEGKMIKGEPIYGFSPETRKKFNEGLTFEQLWDRVEKRLGKNDS